MQQRTSIQQRKAVSSECLSSFPYISAVLVRIPNVISESKSEIALYPFVLEEEEYRNAEKKLKGADYAAAYKAL